MDKRIKVIPSVQVMELLGSSGAYDAAEAVEKLSAFDFYRAAETALPEYEQECARLYRICSATQMRWTCWATPYINAQKLNLSSVDESERVRSVSVLTKLLKRAADSGADAFAVLSGPAPADLSMLPAAVESITRSLTELAAACSGYPDFSLLMEPLDRDVHKKHTIGPTGDATAVIRAARCENPRVFMAWDSAHMALMREDLVTSLSIAADTVGQLHLCNAVLDPQSEMYGDFHMPPGRPGYLTELRAADTIAEASAQMLAVDALPVAIEVRPPTGTDAWETEAKARSFLGEALRLSCQKK